ncbi:hypothetical protein MKEN_00693700 [Mycena kentingensis (nom. inval.)]|nr:hypothetical protein MKEN_00693700 [Mycena kentingensis (nom. inval.)]
MSEHVAGVPLRDTHVWLQGAFLACFAYGAQAVLAGMCVRLLWPSRVRRCDWANNTNSNAIAKRRRRWCLALVSYLLVMFVLSTVYVVGLLQFVQRVVAGTMEQTFWLAAPLGMPANVMMIVLGWMCEALHIWRCFIIYRCSSTLAAKMVIILPAAAFVGTVVLGGLWMKQVGTAPTLNWTTRCFDWTTPYFAVTLGLNSLTTILIVARLLLYRRRLNCALPVSASGQGSDYTTLAGLVVESAAIYTVFSLLFLLSFAFQHPLAQVFLQALCPIQTMSTCLVIFRISQGREWSQRHSEVHEMSSDDIGGTKWACSCSSREDVSGSTIQDIHTTAKDALET